MRNDIISIKKSNNNRIKIKSIIFSMLFLAMTISMISSVSGVNITNSTGDIKTALNNSPNSILLLPGVYSGENNTNIVIDKNVSIIGKDKDQVIINGNGVNNIFTINKGVKVVLENITFINGLSISGGAIFNNGDLFIYNVIFLNNYANDTGGAIFNNGTLNISNSIFTRNVAVYQGAGIFNNNELFVKNSTFNENIIIDDMGDGGAIENNRSNLTVVDSNFTNNIACGGGAIQNDHGFLIVIGSNFMNNNGMYGGAIDNYKEGIGTVINSTFTDNIGGREGAIYNIGTLRVISSNFTNNKATSSNIGAGAIYNEGNLTISISIFINNQGKDCEAIYNRNNNLNINYSIFSISNGKIIHNEQGMTILNNNFWFANDINDIKNHLSGNFVLNSYYHSILTTNNPNGSVPLNKELSYIYSIILNGTNSNEGMGFLPDFMLNITKDGVIVDYINLKQNKSLTTLVSSILTNIKLVYNNKTIANLLYSNYPDFSLNKSKTQIILSNLKGGYSQTIKLIAKLVSNGKVLSGKTVTFYVNNQKVGFGKTDKNGIAKVNYKITKVVMNTVKAIFDSDNSYETTTTYKKFNPTKAKTTLFLYKKLYNQRIYVKLMSYGKVLKNKFIKFYIGGKHVGYGKTNANGITTFKYNKKHGIVNVKTIFNGNKLFSPSYHYRKIKF
jgi:hypothetical protein